VDIWGVVLLVTCLLFAEIVRKSKHSCESIVIAVWWISGRFTAKLREVEERKSHSSNDSEE